MKKNNLFIEFENIKEFEDWFNKQSITRKINRLQVHNMALPDYDCWVQDIKRWGINAALNRTNSLNDYGKNTWGSEASDGKGHHIAQHFNVFPDGHITTGRDLNSTPIGIKGWNTNGICVEIYGNFDKGKDVITKAQAQSVIALYGVMCKRLKLSVNDSIIRPHCWFTASGTYLGAYTPGKSAKSCPGTNFMNVGNSKSAFSNFYSWANSYNKDKSFPKQFGGVISNVDTKPIVPPVDTPTSQPTKYITRYLQTCLNENYGFKLVVDGSFGPASQKAIEKEYLNKGDKGEHVIWLQKALCNRGFKVEVDGSFGNATFEALKKYQSSRGLKADGFGGVDTHKAIIND